MFYVNFIIMVTTVMISVEFYIEFQLKKTSQYGNLRQYVSLLYRIKVPSAAYVENEMKCTALTARSRSVNHASRAMMPSPKTTR